MECMTRRDALRPGDATVCHRESALKCVACKNETCLTHLHAAADGARCTDCYLPDQWFGGHAKPELIDVMAVLRTAFERAESLDYGADVIMAHRGDKADKDGAATRDRVHRMTIESSSLRGGVRMLIKSLMPLLETGQPAGE